MDQLKCSLLVLFYFLPIIACDDLTTLKSISVTFRHGDRSPEPEPVGFYPNDPYKNDPMEPMGQGELTKKGYMREYEFGAKVRERYNNFLGNVYRHREVYSISTHWRRIQTSLLVVLAAMYPPQGEQIWKQGFDWQPVNINALPATLDGLIHSVFCPSYLKELEIVRSSEEYKKDVSRFDTLMKNLTILTGREINNTNAVGMLYHTLLSESGMGLKLPNWTEDYFSSGLLKDAVLFEYRTQTYTTKLKKLHGGTQIRKMLNNLIYHKSKYNKKVILNSVHENTIAALLSAYNLWRNVIPEYGSAIIVELHERDGKKYLKIVYYNGIPPTFETRIIPGCSEYCLLDDFLNILKDVIPDDVVETCFGPPNDSLLIPKSENPTEWFYEKLKEWYMV